jgi:hypothetical protein
MKINKENLWKVLEKYDSKEFNGLCNGLSKIIQNVSKELGKLKYKNIPINKADVIKTHGDNKKIKQKIKSIKFTKIEKSISQTIKWYKKYKELI